MGEDPGRQKTEQRGPKEGNLRSVLGMGKYPMWLGCCLFKGRIDEAGEVVGVRPQGL